MVTVAVLFAFRTDLLTGPKADELTSPRDGGLPVSGPVHPRKTVTCWPRRALDGLTVNVIGACVTLIDVVAGSPAIAGVATATAAPAAAVHRTRAIAFLIMIPPLMGRRLFGVRCSLSPICSSGGFTREYPLIDPTDQITTATQPRPHRYAAPGATRCWSHRQRDGLPVLRA